MRKIGSGTIMQEASPNVIHLSLKWAPLKWDLVLIKQTCGLIHKFSLSIHFTLGSHSGVSVRRASGQDCCSEEPRRLAAHSYETGVREVPPGTMAVLLQDIPGEKGSLRAFLQTRRLWMCHSTCLTIISMFWVWYDHSIRGNATLITNFGISLAQVNWNVVDRFLDMQQGPCSSRQLAIHGSLLRTINRSSDLMPKQFPTQ